MVEIKQIGRYMIKGVLGEGAMGCVFKGHDPNLERMVAIKTMRTNNIQKKEDYKEFKERFFLESVANGRLNHPNIVSVYDSGLHGKDPFLVMEYIEGKPLDVFLEEKDKDQLKYYITLLEQIAAGLDFAHEEGVIHRDVKPGNILVTHTRNKRVRAKLVDFGLAKLNDSKLTQTGYFLGTPSYASPEQVLSGNLDQRSDLFSLGTVAYEALTGLLPFDAGSLHSILYKIANEPAEINFEQFADFLDVHALSCVFNTIFSKDPADRFASATEFVHELKSLTAPLKDMEIPSRRSGKHISVSESAKTSVSPQEKRQPSSASGKSIDIQIKEIRSLFEQAYKARNVSSSNYCLEELKRMGAGTERERALIEELTQQLKEERRKKRAMMVEKARADFELALKTRNPKSVRYCLHELIRLKADTTQESQKLQALEQMLVEEKKRRTDIENTRGKFRQFLDRRDLNSCVALLDHLKELGAEAKDESRALDALKQKEKKELLQREKWILKTRAQFRRALDKKDKDRCAKIFTELQSLLKVDVTLEKKQMAELKEELKREQRIEKTRESFNKALSERNLDLGRSFLAKLEKLETDVRREAKALGLLKSKVKDEDEKKLKSRMLEHTRDSFREALVKKNLAGCRYYLRELRQLVPDITSEERALASLERFITDEEAEHLRSSIIVKLREEFQKAAHGRNIENCRYYLRELRQLEADVDPEEKQLTGLRKRLSAEDELHQNMIQQSRNRFIEALASHDFSAAEHSFKVLRGLGADVTEETIKINKAKRQSQMAMEQEKLKAKMTHQFRLRFHDGFKSKNIDTCRYYLNELKQLGADTNKENAQLAELEP